jgi:polyhydroxyalkanoate synthase subunit PhaC
MASHKNETPLESYQHFAQDWQAIWTKVLDTSQKTFLDHWKDQKPPPPQKGILTIFDPEIIQETLAKAIERLSARPDRLIELQQDHLRDVMDLVKEVGEQIKGGDAHPIVAVDPRDKRFKNDLWHQNPAFFFMQQLYLINAKLLQTILDQLEGLDPQTLTKLEFYTNQLIDALAPTNFPLTNPDVLQETYDSQGENLIQGFKNFLKDSASGSLIIKMTDTEALHLGRDIATTKGKVVYRNPYLELIHYSPTTKTVYEKPILIIPPWINKFYVFDLKPENSFVKWAVDQGLTVFMISWANPTQWHADKTLSNYVLDGVKSALDFILALTQQKTINTIGYCTGGVLLNSLLAYLKAKEQPLVEAVTIIATPVDFKEAGDLLVYVCDQQLKKLEAHVKKRGYLEGNAMVQSFNLLRSNDLIWSFYVNNYLMGKEPVPFDMLHWNGDAVRMPATMHVQFLRDTYLENRLIQPGGIKIGDVPIDLKTLEMPLFIMAALDDHIAPWRSVYPLTQAVQQAEKFVVSGSGHVAGVFNHPDKHKYYFMEADQLYETADQWLDHAQKTAGSWWPAWKEWMVAYSGPKIPAPQLNSQLALADAPGDYVLDQGLI